MIFHEGVRRDHDFLVDILYRKAKAGHHRAATYDNSISREGASSSD